MGAKCTYIQHQVELHYLILLGILSTTLSRNQTNRQMTAIQSGIYLPSLLIMIKKTKIINMNVIFIDPVMTSKRPYD